MFECPLCEQQFAAKKYLQQHIKRGIPCDFVCKICNLVKLKNRFAYTRHVNNCTGDGLDDDKNGIINKYINANNTNNTNNVIFLQPFDVDHYFMNKETTIGPKQRIVVDLLKKEQYARAYEILFSCIHANSKTPEHHNIYLPNIDCSDVVVFRGASFVFEKKEKALARLFSRLKHEMKWLVETCNELICEEKNQLLWDITANSMCVEPHLDHDFLRMLRNNKNVVFKTLLNNVVKSDVKMLENWFSLAEHPSIGQPGFLTKQMINNWADKEGLDCEDSLVHLP